jgi:hypothetical protein
MISDGGSQVGFDPPTCVARGDEVWVAYGLGPGRPGGLAPNTAVRVSASLPRVAAYSPRIRTTTTAPHILASIARLSSVERAQRVRHTGCIADTRGLHDVRKRVLREYCFRYFNQARPHQGIGQLVSIGSPASVAGGGEVVATRPLACERLRATTERGSACRCCTREAGLVSARGVSARARRGHGRRRWS